MDDVVTDMDAINLADPVVTKPRCFCQNMGHWQSIEKNLWVGIPGHKLFYLHHDGLMAVPAKGTWSSVIDRQYEITPEVALGYLSSPSRRLQLGFFQGICEQAGVSYSTNQLKKELGDER